MKTEELSQVVLGKLLEGQTFQAVADDLGISRAWAHRVLTSQDRETWQRHFRQRAIDRQEAAKERQERSRARQWANKPVDRFWENVDVRGPDECWTWGLAKVAGKYNYGYLRWGSKYVYAHRLAWELTSERPIPDGMFVCHHCDNPPCCNPAHLTLATPKWNTQDSIAKGRWGKPRKLTMAQAREMRKLRAEGVRAVDLAKKYRISMGLVYGILNHSRYQEDEGRDG